MSTSTIASESTAAVLADSGTLVRCVIFGFVRVLGAMVMLLAASAAAQGRFVVVGSLRAGRVGHTATLLRDGRVLVVGGRDGLTVLNHCELFEPKAMRFRACANLGEARANHAALLLPDGRVLVTGGVASLGAAFGALGSTEVYEPSKDRWLSGPTLLEPRQGHGMALLQGEIFVVGGTRERVGPLRSTERVTATAATPGPTLLQPRVDGVVAVDDGGMWVVGGRGADGGRPGGALSEVERCTVERCEAAGHLTEGRTRHAVAPWAGQWLVLGGVTPGGMTNYVEVSVDAGFVLHHIHLPMALVGHTASVVADRLLVIGGESPNLTDGAGAISWRGRNEPWCVAGTLFNPRKSHSATVLADGRVLVVGGTSGGLTLRQAEVWSAVKGRCELR